MTSESTAPVGPPPVQDAGPPQTRRQRREREAAQARTAKAGRNLPAAITVGVLLLGGALVGLIWAPIVLAVLVVALLLLGVTETASAISRRGLDIPRVPLWAAAVAMPLGAFAGGTEALVLALTATVALILAWAAVADLPARGETVLSSMFIVMWVPFLLSFAVALLRQDQGNLMVACVLLMVVANDTFGYIVGATFGKHPMAPKVSPKKSWEGFAGSVGGAVVVGTLAVHFLLHHPWWVGSLLGVLTVAAATAGDFAESMVKRELNIKDMGSMLPGHGGAMDRLDSLVFASPIGYMVFALPLA